MSQVGVTLRHVSSSNEDLVSLFNAEKDAIKILKLIDANDSIPLTMKNQIQGYFDEVDYDM